MLDKLGQFLNLAKMAPRLQEEADRLHQRLGQVFAEGDAGAGMVRVRVSGRMEVQSCTLSDEALRLGDREMLEELIKSATNQALHKVRQLVAEETGKMMAGLGLPSGMGLPGLS
jgi:DNA-binding YbaB/EbfC family protein